ncbi:cell volume regulation protein A [Virgibacillus natechei]|uniref:Cell volume regulation protein A n=1 Tax=Virgibacillus natechei TaxID=1216297 RepID=A0ABS4IIR3_9BACI|nr:potassium/proton antiporter [Virgibacillus natechei]MBP1970236.1 cell volume regulation protein A [Virgibacillus natechei]UZD12816.1 potassium/proton antiporter [Virgibacillus natechei]
MNIDIETLIFLLAFMLLIGVFATKFSSRLGLPALVLFLLAGMLLNNFLYFDNVELTQFIGIMALIIILFDGGSQTEWKSIRPVLGAAGTLATLGVLITSAVTGLAAVYILDFSLLEGMLLGAIVGSTDAAAVFAVLGNKNFKKRLTATLEAESGSNDPMAVFLTVALIELIQIPDASIWSTVGSFFIQMGLGLALGLLLGKVTVLIINHIKLDTYGLYPVFAMGFAILTYALTDFLGGSGLLAVYVMAVFVGNSDLTYRFSILRFNEGFAWMMQIVMFTLMGLLVFPSQILDVFWQGILLAVILMFIARPIAVFISMAFMKYTFNQKVFISWAGLKGAVPIVLSIYPVMAGVENSGVIFNAVFFVVLISALTQGSTLSWLATKLGLTDNDDKDANTSMELINLGETDSEIMQVKITKQSPAIGTSLTDLKLPDNTLIIGITRERKLITPTGNSVIENGDTLYVLSDKEDRKKAKEVLVKSR